MPGDMSDVTRDGERESFLIGKAAEKCPWDWDDIRDVIGRGVISFDDIRHCEWCRRFFWVREGHPRRDEALGGRRFGTRECYEAWEMEEAWRVERLGE